MSLDWIHDERITKVSTSVIAEAAVRGAPPLEPLGAAISEQLQQQQQQQPMAIEEAEDKNMAKPLEKINSVDKRNEADANVVEAEYDEYRSVDQQQKHPEKSAEYQKGDETIPTSTTANTSTKVVEVAKKIKEGEEEVSNLVVIVVIPSIDIDYYQLNLEVSLCVRNWFLVLSNST